MTRIINYISETPNPTFRNPIPEKVTDGQGTIMGRITGYRYSWHNMAGRNGRLDVWYTDSSGHRWYGIHIGGWNTILRCLKLKTPK